ncbi:MAG: transglutaminase family protein [Meiothermus sp.]|uniref:transglutaminase family protein n=1 Tax=Meiothermus sp. TaxID=1955249 RepID=UPI0025D81F97|nr:transglutaminase family protein [Meiothermus sp.]MDW8482398.1 transglutaminase family protein [Meiothermus sp.]
MCYFGVVLLSVYHLTEYSYPEAAKDSYNELWLCPADDHRQGLLEFCLNITPPARTQSRRDYFQNRVYQFHIPQPHRQLRVEARARVVTFPSPQPHEVALQALHPLKGRFFDYLTPTPRIPLHHPWLELLDLRQPHPKEGLHAYLLEVTQHIHQVFTYDPEATRLDTPLHQVVRGRAGVCQDYAQAMLAALRSLGIPARYVSGYLVGGVGAEGSHAWVEVFLPGTGWLGYDPTNNSVVGEAYVKKAHGRDYDDCPPLRGQRRGGGLEQLRVSVQVEALEHL